jgi:type IV secretory pathway TraG/TraD family ATPase VirD4
MGKNDEWKIAGYVFGATVAGIGKAAGFLYNGVRGSGWLFAKLMGGHESVLCPGDSTPPGNVAMDYYDYRGVAEAREVRGLHGAGGVSIGRYLGPRGKHGPHLRLPSDLLQRNCAVVGPPGSGKTEGIVIPWILDLLQQGASVVTVDVKGDLVDRVTGPAQEAGIRVWYWNSADAPRSQSWNWLEGVRDSRDIEAAVQSILGRPRAGDPQPFFYERDYRWLRALIAITKQVHSQNSRPRHLYELVADQDVLRELFRQYPQIRSSATELADLLQFPAQEHSRAVSGLLNSLHLFNTPEVVAVTERSDFLLPSISVQPTLLIVGASLADARAAEVLSSILLNQLIAFIYRRFGPGGSGTPMSLYFIIDEAARLRDRINYPELLSVARSARVGICLAAQDVAQFGDEKTYTALLANCLSFFALPGCSAETARYLGSRLGQRMEQVISVSQQKGPFDLLPDQIGKVAQTVMVPVLREREIMHPPVGPYCATVQISPISPKPFLVDLAR